MAPSNGGTNQLLVQYQTIGAALLRFEQKVGWRLGNDSPALEEFHTAVAFIPVEVLETYRDDLLDLSTSDESLFIAAPGQNLHWAIARLAAWIGAGAGVVIGMLAAARNHSLYGALALTLLVAGPFVVLHELMPRRHTRRMRFAQILSDEISGRRGHDIDEAAVRPGFGLRVLVGARPSGSFSRFDAE